MRAVYMPEFKFKLLEGAILQLLPRRDDTLHQCGEIDSSTLNFSPT